MFSTTCCGRSQFLEVAFKRLSEWMEGEPQGLVIESSSPNEVIDFVCAAITNLKEVEQEKVLSRTLIIESKTAWRSLRNHQTPMILLALPQLDLTQEEMTRAVSAGHHVLIPRLKSGRHTDALELERINRFELFKALEECGYPPAHAQQLSNSSGGSSERLKGLLTTSHTPPVWSNDRNGRAIASCLLLSGWDDRSEFLLHEFSRARSHRPCQVIPALQMPFG